MTLPSFSKSKFVISRSWLIFLLIASFVVLLFILTFQWAKHNRLFTLSGNTSQHFTELYFSDLHTIPEKLKAGVTYSVPFAIANSEGTAKTYTYKVTVTEGSTLRSSSTNSISVPDGARVIQQARFTTHDASAVTALSVELLSEDQVITYRMGR